MIFTLRVLLNASKSLIITGSVKLMVMMLSVVTEVILPEGGTTSLQTPFSQRKPTSTCQVFEQPSPLSKLPSSHSYCPLSMPSPQISLHSPNESI